MHSSRALASILPNCSSRHLYQYSCQPAVYDCNLELKGHCWYFFQILGKVVPSTFHKQFRVCHGLEDKEKKWALKRRVRGLNMNFFFFFCLKVKIALHALAGRTDCRKEGQGDLSLTLYSCSEALFFSLVFPLVYPSLNFCCLLFLWFSSKWRYLQDRNIWESEIIFKKLHLYSWK